MVDAPPEALLEGRGEGQPPPTCRAPASCSNCANWRCCWPPTSLKRQLQEYLDEHGVGRGGARRSACWYASRRGRAHSENAHSGRRNATRFHGALLAAYVEQAELAAADRSQLERNMALAREMGAEIHCLTGTDFVSAILDFAREQRVTQLFIGHSMRDGRKPLGAARSTG